MRKSLFLLACVWLLDVASAKGPGMEQCTDITVEFRQPSNRIIINDIIGIRDGDQVEIRCECTKSRASTAVWITDGDEVSTEYEDAQTPYNDVNGDRATLRIYRFEDEATGQYICESRDTSVEFNLVWYDPNGRPDIIVDPEDANTNIINGNENITLQCAALGADDYTWERRDGSLPSNSTIINQDYKSILVIPNIRREDAGEYRCVAAGSGSRNSRYARVTVTEQIDIVTDPQDTMQTVGTSVTLSCSSAGFRSENFVYTWTRSNQVVLVEATSTGTSNLVLSAVKITDAGDYVCMVENEWGAQVASRPATLQVITPESFPPIDTPVGSTDEFSVTLTWQLSNVNAQLLDRVTISYQWVSLLEDNSRKRQTNNAQSSLVTINDPTVTQHTITDLQPYSNYCFTVAAHYAFDGQTLGVVEAPQFCTDTREAIPSTPLNLMVISQDFTSVSVTWSTPQSPNGIITHYTMKYDNHTKRVAVEDVKPSVMLSQLQPATPYNITVSANTAVGEGAGISIIISTDNPNLMDTTSILFFQIKFVLDANQTCPQWTSNNRRQLLTNVITSYIEKSCQCMVEDGAIEQDHLLCDQTKPSETVYRAKLTTTVLTIPVLTDIVEGIVARGVFMDNTTSSTVDTTCPVVIRSFRDEICNLTTDSVTNKEESGSSNNGLVNALVGIGALIALIALLIVLVLIVLLYRRHKRRVSDSNEINIVKNNTVAPTETLPPYSEPLKLPLDDSIKVQPSECQTGEDGYLVPVHNNMENTDLPIPYVEFDDEIYFKSIRKNTQIARSQSAKIKMDTNPSYQETMIPQYDSTEV